jgi:hypothetical protein
VAAGEALARRRVAAPLVPLALARFRRRPAFGRRPRTSQADRKAFSGNDTKPCAGAEELRFTAGDTEAGPTGRAEDSVPARGHRRRRGKRPAARAAPPAIARGRNQPPSYRRRGPPERR